MCRRCRKLQMEDKTVSSKSVAMENTEVEDDIVLKKKIACHPMFELLKEAHLNCLKMCLGNNEEEEDTGVDLSLYRTKESFTDLDLFMEAYYVTMVGLKKAIQEPMQEASEFLEFMHCLLAELTQTPSTHSLEEEVDRDEEVDDEQYKCELFCGCKGAVETVTEEIGKIGIKN